MNNTVVQHLAIHRGCEHTHTADSEKKLYVPYAMGVSTPKPSERKPYMMYVVGMGSPIPFQEAESFSYMPYVIHVTTPLF